MRVAQVAWDAKKGFLGPLGELPEAQLVFAFGSPAALAARDALARARKAWPAAQLVGCSTAGEILGTRVFDDSLVFTALRFERSRIEVRTLPLPKAESSEQVGEALARAMPPSGLRHLLVLSEGIHVNGSALVAGLLRGLPAGAGLSGGLSGDGIHFGRTLIAADGRCTAGLVAAVGFYGPLEIRCASLGGWDPFGPEREITRAEGNVLYELDGQPALELYKRYLGPHAADLPASGLLFPLSLRLGESFGDPSLVRTILGVDEERGSLSFAGDMPVGAYARLMKANFERLIEGAVGAAQEARGPQGPPPEVALLISCVGRKMVLGQRIEEEVEGVRHVLGDSVPLCGFYSYGELSPLVPGAGCELHNQTMTITAIREL